jgi:hypothetical protein
MRPWRQGGEQYYSIFSEKQIQEYKNKGFDHSHTRANKSHKRSGTEGPKNVYAGTNHSQTMPLIDINNRCSRIIEEEDDCLLRNEK